MTGPGTRARIAPRAATAWLFVLAPFVVLLAGAGFATLETDTVSSYWEGLWWALSLMTTVGFVGESPETTAGRVLSAILMLSGFALLALATAALASLFVREEEAPEEQRERDFARAAIERLDALGARLDAIEHALALSAAESPGGSPEPTGSNEYAGTQPGAHPGAPSPDALLRAEGVEKRVTDAR